MRHRPPRRPLVALAPLQDLRVLRLGRPQAVFHSAVQLQLLQLLLLVRPLPQRLVSVRPQGRLRGLPLPQRRNRQQAGASPSVQQRAAHLLLPLQSRQPLVGSRLVLQGRLLLLRQERRLMAPA